MAHRRGAMLPVWGAYIISAIAIGMSSYSIWLEPAKINAQLKLAREMGKLAEYLDAHDERKAENARLNAENKRLKDAAGQSN